MVAFFVALGIALLDAVRNGVSTAPVNNAKPAPGTAVAIPVKEN